MTRGKVKIVSLILLSEFNFLIRRIRYIRFQKHINTLLNNNKIKHKNKSFVNYSTMVFRILSVFQTLREFDEAFEAYRNSNPSSELNQRLAMKECTT